MSTRYYLHAGDQAFFSGSPSTEQSPDVPHTSSFWGVPPLTAARPFYRLKLTPNSSYSRQRDTGAIAPPTSASMWVGWWTTPALTAGVLTGGTLGLYLSHGDWSNSNERGFIVPRFYVYQWRPGTGVVTSLLNPTNGAAPGNEGATLKVLSSSFTYTGATLQDGDRLIFELWATSSFSGSPVAMSHQYVHEWMGFATGALDGSSSSLQPNGIASWIEFSENLPAESSSLVVPSPVYMLSASVHPTDANKIRVSFSGPIATQSIGYTNFSVSSSFPTSQLMLPKQVAAVEGTNNSIVDLHFGEDLTGSASTFALWKFDERGSNHVLDDAATFHMSSSAVAVLSGVFKSARSFTSGSNLAAWSTPTLSPRSASLREWTIDSLFRWQTSDSFGLLFGYAGSGVSTLVADNYLIGMFTRQNGRLNIFWESGSAGTGVATANNDVPLTTLIPGNLHLWTVRKKLLSGTNGDHDALYNVDFFFDRRYLYTFSALKNASFGTGPSMSFHAGRDEVTPTNGRFVGSIDTIRFSTGALSDAAILSVHDAYFPLTRGSTYIVSASNVFDPAGRMLMEPSSSYIFQYFAQNSVPLSGNLDFPASATTASYTIPGSSAGSESEDLSLFVLFDVPCDCSIEYTPPTITNFVPAVGSQITRLQQLQFDVTDDGPLRRVILEVRYPENGIQEVIHDGVGFGLKYQGGSNTRTQIAGGFRYTMLRDGGWPENPTITPFAIDISGSENL